MMKIRNKKSSRTIKRALAFVMSFALAMSTFAVSPSADAASKKAPKLSAKKKSLTVKESYTLKVKKNKVKKITKTTWKTSKKSVVAISKKKKTSVKLTAKKAGKAKITATVKYTVKGSKKVQTKKLTCTVTSKKAAAVTPTATATAAVTATATAGATATATATVTATAPAEPTATAPTEPTAVPVASAITLDKAEATIGTAAGKNTVTLTATVKDAAGNAMTDQAITWTSDKAEVATVDEKGVVTAVADGEATITAALGALSATCKVTVDGVVPTIAKAEVTDYKTITVTLSEEVTGTPDVKVYLNAGTAAMKTTEAALAADGKSIVITNSEALKVATYKVVINGLTDKVGNAMAKDASAEAEKETSTIKEVVPSAKEAPAPGINYTVNGVAKHTPETVKVYYTVIDQYGESMDVIDVPGKLTATAKINGTDYPLTAVPTNNETGTGKSYITISKDSALVAGKVIDITVTNKVSDAVKYSSSFSITLTKQDGYGVAANFEKVSVSSTKMKNKGTEIAPEFTLESDSTKNTFGIKSKLLDKFAYPVEGGNVKYVSSDTNILCFASSKSSASAAHDEEVQVFAVGKGEATITAYLENNDMVSYKIPVKVNPVELTDISVSDTKSVDDSYKGGDVKEATNGVNNYYPITLNAGSTVNTGLKATDLHVKVLSGDATVTLYDGIGTEANPDKTYATDSGTIYANVVPAADGKAKTIEYIVYTGTYDETAKKVKDGKSSGTVKVTTKASTFVSKIDIEAFGENIVTAGTYHTTEYKLFNAQNENITKVATDENLKVVSNVDAVITNVKKDYVDELGKGLLTLTIAPDVEGRTASVTMSKDLGATSLSVNVVAKAEVTKMTFVGNGQVVKNDTLPIEYGVDTERVSIKDKKYKIVPVTFTNQFGNAMKVSASELDDYNTLDEETTGIEIVGLYKDVDGSYVEADTEVSALGIAVTDTTEAKAEDSKAVYATFTKKTDDGMKKLGSFGITPLAQRVITTFKDSAGELPVYTVTKGGVVSGKNITAQDQYGRTLSIQGTISSNNPDVAIGTIGWGTEYNLTVTADEDTTATITYNSTGFGTKSFDIVIKVVDATKIDKFTINPSIKSSAVEKSHDSSKYLVQLSENDDTNLTLGVIASAAGTSVDVNAADAFDWEVVESSIKNVAPGTLQDGTPSSCKVTMKNNVVTISAADGVVKGSVTVRAKAKNGKVTAEYTFNVSNAKATPQDDTYYLSKKASVSEAWYNKTTTYKYEGDKYGTFYVYALNQYGIDMEATDGITSVTSQDSKKLAVSYIDIIVYCLPLEASTTDVVINFVGKSKSITVPVTATKKCKEGTELPKAYVISGDALGASASFTYKGFGAYAAVATTTLDKTKFEDGKDLTITYTLTGDKYTTETEKLFQWSIVPDMSTPWVYDAAGYDVGGGTLTISANDLKKVAAEHNANLVISTAGSVTDYASKIKITSVKIGENDVTEGTSWSYPDPKVMPQYGKTAVVTLSEDFDLSPYNSVRVEYEAKDSSKFDKFQAVITRGDKNDPNWNVSGGAGTITLDKVKNASTGNKVEIHLQSAVSGFAYEGTVRITKITFFG